MSSQLHAPEETRNLITSELELISRDLEQLGRDLDWVGQQLEAERCGCQQHGPVVSHQPLDEEGSCQQGDALGSCQQGDALGSCQQGDALGSCQQGDALGSCHQLCIEGRRRRQLLGGEGCSNDSKEQDMSAVMMPEEMWVRVFSFLSQQELCLVSRVNRQFYRLAMDPSLWREVVLLSDAIADTESAIRLLNRCSQLASLTLMCREDAAALLPLLGRQLRHLTVRFCPVISYSELEALGEACPGLRTLNLEAQRLNFQEKGTECTGCHNQDGDSHEMEGSNPCGCAPTNSFTNLFSRLTRLQSLNLFACKNLTSHGLMQIADHCPLLEELNIDEVNFLTDASVNHLIDKGRGPLRFLSIDGETLSDEAFGRLDELADTLELLSISFADSLGERGLRAISRLAKLEWLKVRRASQLLPNSFVQAFADGRLGQHLLFLDLSECSMLSDAGLIAVAQNCPRLGTLNLCWCWELTDISLLCVVNSCKFLISLNLCGVVRLCGDFLEGITELLRGLQYLDLEQCPNIETCVLRDIVSCKPNLQVKDYYGDEVSPM